MQNDRITTADACHSRWWNARNCGLAAAFVGMAMISRRSLVPRLRHAIRRRTAHSDVPLPVEDGNIGQPCAESENQLLAQRSAKLEQTMAALEGFCYTIAHDLRAPLRSMDGFAQALLEDYGDRLDAQGVDYAKRICAAARRMDRMIQDLLDFEKLATFEPVATRIETGRVVDKVLVSMADEFRRRRAQVIVQRPLMATHANGALLEKVLRELLSNAMRFTPPGTRPHVSIRTQLQDQTVALIVEDKGIGIAPEHQEQIFDPFVRLHGQDDHAGTGIGLAIVKRSIERMAGKVELESTLGKGTCLRISLPAA